VTDNPGPAADPGLRRLALRTLLPAFPGTEAPPWALALVAEGLAGYAFFGFNIGTRAQVASLTATLRSARSGVIVAVDEEGGDVTRLGHATGSPYPGNAALGVVDDPDLTAAVYAAVGAELYSLGFTMNLAPSVDVNTAAENPIIGTRSFGSDPAVVARHAIAAVRGLQSAGIAACAKHFPGHGATIVDSHLELPTVDCAMDVLRARDLPPFVAAVSADTRAIMTAHIRVPVLTGDDPATLSAPALTGLLRGELGYDGVIVTDGLEMRGVSGTIGMPEAAVRSLGAGADLLCLGADITALHVEAVVVAVATAIADGRLPTARVEEAAARVGALAAWSVDSARRVTPNFTGPQLGLAAARRAVAVEGTLPDLQGNAFVLQVASGHSIAEGVVPWGLGPHAHGVELLPVVPEEASVQSLLARAAGRPIVVVGRHLHRREATRHLVETLAGAHPVVVVEMGWPATWRPIGAAAFLRTYGASRANGRAAAEALGLTTAA